MEELLLFVLLPSILVSTARCSQCDDDSFVSFNAFLVPGFEYERRLERLMQVLGQENSDVVCLQEVWLERDIRKLLSAVGDKFPFSWSFLHQSDGHLSASDSFPSNACTVKDMYYYMDCVKERCIHLHSLHRLDSNSVISCILQHCNPSMYLGERCFECSVIGCFNPSNIARSLECQANLTQPHSGLCETLSPEIRHRTSGLLLLSKRKLRDLRRHVFYKTNSLFSRGYLAAKTDKDDQVVCTQLTSNMGTYYYDIVSGFASYKEQNGYELRQLLAPFSGDTRAVIMGDLGASPALPGVSPVFPDNLAELADFGFTSLTSRLAHCTYCSENPLNRDHGSQQSTIQDHILVHTRSNARIKEIKIKYDCLSLPLSDHYAVQVTLGGATQTTDEL